MAPRPIRLQRLRKAGFDLQATSLAANGLPAVCVDRSTIWGNPFSVEIDAPDDAPDDVKVTLVDPNKENW